MYLSMCTHACICVDTCVFRDLRLVLNVFLYSSSALFTKVGSLNQTQISLIDTAPAGSLSQTQISLVDTAPVASQPASAKA